MRCSNLLQKQKSPNVNRRFIAGLESFNAANVKKFKTPFPKLEKRLFASSVRVLSQIGGLRNGKFISDPRKSMASRCRVANVGFDVSAVSG